MSRGKHVSLTLQIILAMILGILVGSIFGQNTPPFGIIGSLLIQLIKALAVPLLFFGILDSVLETEIRGKSFLKLLGICTLNSALALAIGLGISNLFRPGLSLQPLIGSTKAEPPLFNWDVTFGQSFKKYVPSNLISPFAENQILTLIFLAVIMGLALRKSNIKLEPVKSLVSSALEMFRVLLKWTVAWVPLAVFAVVAELVGDKGVAAFRGLGVYVGFCLLGMVLHIALVYQTWVFAIARKNLRKFWSAASEAVVYAAGANSSLATLPITLRALDDLKVSKESSTLGACVGTNFNNDGIILYEAMAVLMIAQAYGFSLTISQQLSAALVCLAAGVGVAGVPEAGLISLSLVLSTVGLPAEVLPLLMSADWIVARMRSVTNVLGDMTVSIGMDVKGFRHRT